MSIQNLLIKANDFFFVTFNEKGHLITASNGFSQHFNYNGHPQTHASFFDTIISDDRLSITPLTDFINDPSAQVISLQLQHRKANKSCTEVSWNLTKYRSGKDVIIEGLGRELQEASSENNHNLTVKDDEHLLRLKKIMDYSLDIICTTDNEGRFITVSNACTHILGYAPQELVGQNLIEFVFHEDVDKTVAAAQETREGKEINFFENRCVRKDGSTVTMFWTAKFDPTDKTMYCVARDGTVRKNFEAAIKSSQEKYKLLFDKNPQPLWIFEVSTFKFLEVNEAAIKYYGYTREEFLAMTIKDIRPVEEIPRLIELHVQKPNEPTEKTIWRHKKKNGQTIHVEITAYPLMFDGKQAKLALANDITERIKAEDELIKSNERYTYVSNAAFDAIWDWNLQTNEVVWNEGYHSIFGHQLEEFRERKSTWTDHVHEADKERVLKSIDAAIKHGNVMWEEEYRFLKADNTYAYVIDRGIIIKDSNNKPYRMIGAMQDYTAKKNYEHSLKELNASLEKRASELASSNQELERFAYVASHDLQEPLRMVSSFLQLLQKRYKSILDEKANEYIHFAVDGADRMKILILDLLRYSRVNTIKEEHEQVDLNEIWPNILSTYKQIIDETKAEIKIGKMPVLSAARTQLVQLFQNLVGNALKYRSNKAPIVEIEAREESDCWLFSVKDNGIGIDSRFYQKIFVIFQRLHHKDEYSGTGIGLAICKKIIERHGGKIWVESVIGEGSCFYFTLKKIPQ